jgi:chromosome segregation ATPase
MISNRDNIIDSRDIIAKFEDLEIEREDIISKLDEAKEELRDTNKTDPENEEKVQELDNIIADTERELENWEYDYLDEYNSLKSLIEEASDSPDWFYGETLIKDSYFETYAQEFAEDIGAIEKSSQWPNYCIDWEWAAKELQIDYFTVNFDGETYWIRG